jgi:hypothetical protein
MRHGTWDMGHETWDMKMNSNPAFFRQIAKNMKVLLPKYE